MKWPEGFRDFVTPMYATIPGNVETLELMGAIATDHDRDTYRLLLDLYELLSEEDQRVLDAIVFERVSYETLASRMGYSSKSVAWRATQQAIGRLKNLWETHG